MRTMVADRVLRLERHGYVMERINDGARFTGAAFPAGQSGRLPIR
jgi:hypothetical protein